MRNTVLFCVMVAVSFCCACTPEVEICKWRDGADAAVSLTFDDGIIDHYTLVAPCLDGLGLKGTFWVNPAFIGHEDDYAPRMTWDNCRYMASAGHEISSHGWSHKNLYSCPFDEAMEEITRCDDEIERQTGRRPITYCFAFNAYTPQVAEFCEKGRVGIRYFQEAQGQEESHSTAESLRNWLDELISDGEWGVTMTHGINYGWDKWNDPQVLWDFYEYLSSRRDRVWEATFAEVSAYIKERDACTLKVKGNRHSVTVEPRCELDSTIFHERLSVRIKDGTKSYLVGIDPFGGPQTIDLDNPFCGKKLVVVGDSYARNHVGEISDTWHCKMARRHNMRYENFGINGNSIAFDRSSEGFGPALCERYRHLPKDADYILILAGHNDAYMVDSPEALSVFTGRLNTLCSSLKADYPAAVIGWMAPWDIDFPGITTVRDSIEAACLKYEIVYVDNSDSGINANDPSFRSKYFQSPQDNAHLNSKGHDLLSAWSERVLEQFGKIASSLQ